jgi:hypothetical protein
MQQIHEELAKEMRCVTVDRHCVADRCMAWQGQRVQGKDGVVTDTHMGYCRMTTLHDERVSSYTGGPR